MILDVEFRYLLCLFALYLTASDAARLIGLSVGAVNALCLRLRHRLMASSSVPAELGGAVELDESYLVPRRIRGKRGQDASGKTIVFSLLSNGAEVIV